MPFQVGDWVRLGGDDCTSSLRGYLARIEGIYEDGFYQINIPSQSPWVWSAGRSILQPLTETELVCLLLEQE